MNIFAIIIPDDEQAANGLGLLASAKRIGAAAAGGVHAIVLGTAHQAGLPHKLFHAGANSVLVVSHAAMARPVQSGQLLEMLVEALPEATANCPRNTPSLFLFAASMLGDELAAGAAFRMGGTALGRCADIESANDKLLASRAAFGGRVTVKLQASATRSFACIRAGEGASVPVSRESAILPRSLRELALTKPLPAPLHTIFEEQPTRKQRVGAAKVVVSGGRGIGSPEGFEQLDALAVALNGTLAGSLPAVDAGWVPVSSQVGQSGNYVTPLVYVAVGISGTLQHLAGIGPNVRIVAINNDPEARIFQEAQLGIVADWRAVVPLITARLQAGEASGAVPEKGLV